MYSGGIDSSAHISVTTSKGKTTAIYHQKSPGSMETHWEEDAVNYTTHEGKLSIIRNQGSR